MDVLIVIAIVWVAPIFVAASVGNPKGRAGWLYGILLGWLGVLLVALLPPKPHVQVAIQQERQLEMSHRQCPHCMEPMNREASVCPHCRMQSVPWKFDQGRWWRQVDGQWMWLNKQGVWDTRLRELT